LHGDAVAIDKAQGNDLFQFVQVKPPWGRWQIGARAT
jgi:hypothetical protein